LFATVFLKSSLILYLQLPLSILVHLSGMKKDTLVIIFYVLYFSWLFTVTYLTQDIKVLNYYTICVALFYFLFLREKGDILWFILGISFSVLLTITSYSSFQLKFDTSIIPYLPIWLPMAWGTTVIALRKFVLLLER